MLEEHLETPSPFWSRDFCSLQDYLDWCDANEESGEEEYENKQAKEFYEL